MSGHSSTKTVVRWRRENRLKSAEPFQNGSSDVNCLSNWSWNKKFERLLVIIISVKRNAPGYNIVNLGGERFEKNRATINDASLFGMTFLFLSYSVVSVFLLFGCMSESGRDVNWSTSHPTCMSTDTRNLNVADVERTRKCINWLCI